MDSGGGRLRRRPLSRAERADQRTRTDLSAGLLCVSLGARAGALLS